MKLPYKYGSSVPFHPTPTCRKADSRAPQHVNAPRFEAISTRPASSSRPSSRPPRSTPAAPTPLRSMPTCATRIVRGDLPPGAALSEAAIAEAVGTSRTPVREALQQLLREELVEVYPQVGTRVAPLRVALIQEGCFVRRSLECANLLDLVGTITAAQRRELRSVLLQHQRGAWPRRHARPCSAWTKPCTGACSSSPADRGCGRLSRGPSSTSTGCGGSCSIAIPRHAERILSEHRGLYERLIAERPARHECGDAAAHRGGRRAPDRAARLPPRELVRGLTRTRARVAACAGEQPTTERRKKVCENRSCGILIALLCGLVLLGPTIVFAQKITV